MSMEAAVFSTSMLIAAAELLAARRERRHDLPAQLARASLAACGPAGARLLRCTDSMIGRLSLRIGQAVMLPGIAVHYAWRKRRIWRWVEAELAAGARQLLVLGAGFDALGPCMAARHPALRVLEIDRPGIIGIRRQALREVGIASPRLVLRGADLARSRLRQLLPGFDGFDRNARTVVVAEGLLMYLQPDAMAALWRDLRGGCDVGVHVIATAMAPGRDGKPRFHRQGPWLRRWLERRNEPFLWGAARDRLHAAMADAGLAVDRIADPDDCGDPDPCPGEWLFSGTLLPH